jgi:hypothetical protein
VKAQKGAPKQSTKTPTGSEPRHHTNKPDAKQKNKPRELNKIIPLPPLKQKTTKAEQKIPTSPP